MRKKKKNKGGNGMTIEGLSRRGTLMVEVVIKVVKIVR